MPNGRYRIVVLGDSIQWGQGLPEPQKFSELVRQTIERELGREAIIEHRFANSGAILGAPEDTWEGGDLFDQHSPMPFWGEVPSPRGTPQIRAPGIHAQFNALRTLLTTPEGNRLNTIDLVLVDSGINNVGLENIINPLANEEDLRRRTRTACFDEMLGLLRRITGVGPDGNGFPHARVVVTGYNPLFSLLSAPLPLIAWLAASEIYIPTTLLTGPITPLAAPPLIIRLAQLSEIFAVTAMLSLREAVNTVNDELEQSGQPRRVAYAHVPFGPENCLFAPASWLFGLTPILTPEDPVASQRAPLCAASEHWVNNPFCLMASVGHPNLLGSWQYSRAIIRTLRDLEVLRHGNILVRVCNWAQEQELRCLQWRENQRDQCAAVEVAEIALCNTAHIQRLNACNAIQCNAFTNCGQIQCNAFANCAWWNVPCHFARVVCVAAAAVAQAACWAARGVCVAAAAVARTACTAGSAMILAACITVALTRRAACVIGTEIVSRTCTTFTWVVTRLTCW